MFGIVSVLRFGSNLFVLTFNLNFFTTLFNVNSWVIFLLIILLEVVRQLLLSVFNSSSMPIFAHKRLGLKFASETAVVLVLNKITAIVSVTLNKGIHSQSFVGDQVHRIFLSIKLYKRWDLFQLVQSNFLRNITFGIPFLKLISSLLTVKL